MGQNSESKPCRRRRLAQGSVAAVEWCSCGAVQLVMGPMTLRLAPEALGDLQQTLSAAVAELDAAAAASPLAFAAQQRGQA